jgi:hypothetical protein
MNMTFRKDTSPDAPPQDLKIQPKKVSILRDSASSNMFKIKQKKKPAPRHTVKNVATEESMNMEIETNDILAIGPGSIVSPANR